MKKKIVKITGILVVLLSVAGFWGYNKYFKPDPEIQQQLNNQFGEDFFRIDGELANEPSGTSDQTPNDSLETIGESSNPKPETEKVQQGSNKDTTSSDINEVTVEKQITQEQVVNKYKPKFAYLQSIALGRLDTLYSAAAQEYDQLRKAGTLNRSALAQKYIQAGTMLEANVDNQFYSTLNAMEAELIANNLPTDVIAASKAEYQNAKSSKRGQLLAKVRK